MADDDNQTPSWLSETPEPAPTPAAAPAPVPVATTVPVNTVAAAAPAPQNVSAPAAAAPAPPADPADLASVEQEQLRGIILFTRLLNMGVSIAVIAMAITEFIGIRGAKTYVLGAYATCGGCLICCLETQLKFVRTSIAMNFGFLFNPMFRFAFYLLMATVCVSFKRLFGFIVGGALVGVAFYNTYVLIKYPAYRQLRDELAKEEDKRIEGKVREKMRAEASRQMFNR